MGKLFEQFALCISFFSCIPLPGFLSRKITDKSNLTKAVTLFPLIGLIIGIFPAMVWYLAHMALPASIAAGLAIGFGLLLTGALHEDGFADCADGFGGGSDSEKVLNIMRDSAIGTYGGAALILSIALRWAALASLTPLAGIAALLIAHSGSRAALSIAMQFSTYARKSGIGKLASDTLQTMDFPVTLTIAFALAFLLGSWQGVIALTIALAFAWVFLKYAEYRIDGYTGDVFGGMQQISEISILITLAGLWS